MTRGWRRIRSSTIALALGCSLFGPSPSAPAQPAQCDALPTGIATTDYWIAFKTPHGLMPDPRFDGRRAKLRVHAVTPTYEHAPCRDVRRLAAVLIHGRTTPGSVSYDLRHPTRTDPAGVDISLQAAMARAGIHTFAPDLIGYGRSTRFADGLDNPCNASLPTDTTRNAAIFPLDQQGRYLGDGLSPPADGLGVNPLGGQRCAHSSSTYFANPDVFARDIRQVIDDVILRVRPDGRKVVLVGGSFGGPSVARTLYLMGDAAKRKVSRVVFVASLFNRFPGPAVEMNLPTEESGLSPVERSLSFPLTLSRVGGWTGVATTEREDFCSGRVIDGVPEDMKAQLLALDPLGASWGGSNPAEPTGLLRSPTFSLYGWNRAVAATFTLPTLILHGADDLVAPVANSDNIYDALTAVEDKVLVKIQCASHQMTAEGCGGLRCDDGDQDTQPYGDSSPVWSGPHRTVAAAIIEWVTAGTFDGNRSGRFTVNESGIAQPVTP